MSSRRGFSLIELVLVVAIIGIIVSIAVSVAGKAEDRAKTTQCLSNLRQIATGVLAYGTDHDGKLVPMESIDPEHHTWMTYLSYGGYVPAPPSASAGIITGDRSVFRCPSDSKTIAAGIPTPSSRSDPAGAQVVAVDGADPSGRAVYYHVSYAVNGCSVDEQQYPLARDPAENDQPTVSHRLGDIPFPTKTVLACDGVYCLSGVDGRLNLRHANKTQVNLVFMDGHGGTFFSKQVPLVSDTIGADYPRFRVDYSDPITGL